MKKTLFTALCLITLAATQPLSAQKPAPVRPVPAEEPVPPVAPEPPPAPIDATTGEVQSNQKLQRQADAEARQMDAQARKMDAQVRQAAASAEKMRGQYDVAITNYMNMFPSMDSTFKSMTLFGGTPQPQPARSLIVRSSDTDSKSLGAAEEDLSVMARILDKAVAKTGEDEQKQAMGIPITSFGSGVKNLQLEGYGVIFLLKVNFPLSGPETKTVEEKPKEPTNSTWDEAKEELYGTHHSTANVSATPAVEFDPKRVDELKDALLDALRNSANIRSLKDNESVTVVVTSSNEKAKSTVRYRPLRTSGSSSGGGGPSAPGPNPFMVDASHVYAWSSEEASHPSHSGGTLTIKVKKQDIDSFFKGKLNLDEFRRKATVALY